MQVHIMATRRGEVPVVSLVIATLRSRYMSPCLFDSLQVGMENFSTVAQ